MRDAVGTRNSLWGEAVGKYPFLGSCEDAFQGDFTVPEGGGVVYATVLDLRGIVEGDGVYDTYPLLPKRAGDDAADAKDRFDYLAKAIRGFAGRDGEAIKFSVSDQIFNQDKAHTVRATSDQNYKDYLGSKEFASVRAKEAEAVPQELRKRQKDLTKELAGLAAAIVKEDEGLDLLEVSVRDAVTASIDASKPVGVAELLASYSLDVVETAGALDVRFGVTSKYQPDGATEGKAPRKVYGCVATGDTPCTPTPGAGGEWVQAQAATFDPELQELVIDIALDDPVTLGFPARERSEDRTDFNDLTVDQLAGRTLRLTYWPNRLDGVLDFVTGKVQVFEADGTKSHEGSLTGDTFH
jgi:hypothetical protein